MLRDQGLCPEPPTCMVKLILHVVLGGQEVRDYYVS